MRAAILLLAAACAGGSSPNAGCNTVIVDFASFSVCDLSRDSTQIIYGRYRHLDTMSLPYWDPLENCERAWDDVTIDVSSALKGPVSSGTLHFAIGGYMSLGSLDNATSEDGLFFLWPYAGGQLGIAPTGGFFWQHAGSWVNVGQYKSGLTMDELEAKAASPDGGACPYGW